MSLDIDIKYLRTQEYSVVQQAMQRFTNERAEDSRDEVWLVEHPAVYTQGTACDLNTHTATGIPVVKSDRGGQITYHGPGQVVLYPLLKLKRYGLTVKSLVHLLEQVAIDVLAHYDLQAVRREGAPGVYLDDAKIAALGLRIRRGFSYHGLSFNVDMDLSPYQHVDPCGYKGLEVTQLKDHLDSPIDTAQVMQQLKDRLLLLLQKGE